MTLAAPKGGGIPFPGPFAGTSNLVETHKGSAGGRVPNRGVGEYLQPLIVIVYLLCDM